MSTPRKKPAAKKPSVTKISLSMQDGNAAPLTFIVDIEGDSPGGDGRRGVAEALEMFAKMLRRGSIN